jgi:hypothetical protein
MDINLPEPEPPLGPVPDIGLLTEGLEQAATGLVQANTELAKFGNLPPIAQSSAILHQLRQMQLTQQQMQQQTQQRMQQMMQQMQQQMQQMQQNIQQQMQLQLHQLRNDLVAGYQAM